MNKQIWALVEGCVGFILGSFRGACLAGPVTFFAETLGWDPGRGLSDSLLTAHVAVVTAISLSFALAYCRRARHVYEGRGKSRASVVVGEGGKLELTPASLLAFVLCAAVLSFWTIVIRTVLPFLR